MFRVPVLVVLPPAPGVCHHVVNVEPQAHISSGRVTEAAKTEIGRELSLPQHTLAIEGRYVENGSPRTGLPDIPAKDFVEELKGELIVSVPPAVCSLPADIHLFKTELSQHRARLESLEADRATTAVLLKQLKEQNAILATDSFRYRGVVLRYVVEQAHVKLQAKFGAKQDGVSWQAYVTAALQKDQDWFNKNGLMDNLSLLYKGFGTAFQAGNNAAHRPDKAVVDRIVEAAAEDEPVWGHLWRLASA